MRRREFIAALAGAAAAWPLTAGAQQKPVIGFLNSGSPDAYPDRVIAFHQGLRQLGYIEGENIVVDYRWAHNRPGGNATGANILAAEMDGKRVALLH